MRPANIIPPMLQNRSQESPLVHTFCKLPSRTRMPPKSPLTPKDFHLAVHRLRKNEGDPTPKALVNTSLALLNASDICGWAQHVLRVLSGYRLNLDYEAGGEVRDGLIEPIIVKRQVKKATVLGEMRANGCMVRELLDWFRPYMSCPWAIIFVLIVFIGEASMIFRLIKLNLIDSARPRKAQLERAS